MKTLVPPTPRMRHLRRTAHLPRRKLQPASAGLAYQPRISNPRRQCRTVFGATLVLIALFAALAAPADAAPHPTDPAPLAEYRARIAQALTALQDTASSDSARMEAGRAALRPAQKVQLPSGVVVNVLPLLNDLRDPDDAIARLELMAAQLDAAQVEPSGERLAQLQAVLARRELTPRPRGLWERFTDWLSQQLRRLWGEPAEDTVASEAVARVVAYVLAVVGGLLALVLLSYWLAGLARGFVAEAGKQQSPHNDEGLLTAEGARTRAAALAQAHDYRGSVRLLYLSLLLEIEEHGLVRRDRSLTDRELLERVAPGAPSVGERMAPVISEFDRVWYGMHQPDERTYAQYRADVEALGEAIERAVRPPTGSTSAGKEGSDA